MMHEVTFRIVNVTKSSRFGLTKTAHRQDYRPWLWERASSRTWVCADGTGGYPPGRCLRSFFFSS